MSENNEASADESDWPLRTDWRDLAEQPDYERRDWTHQLQQMTVERERNRKPEPPPSERLGFWGRLMSRKCRSCGRHGGPEEVPAWRDGWQTSRCKYCLTWTQEMTPVEYMGHP